VVAPGFPALGLTAKSTDPARFVDSMWTYRHGPAISRVVTALRTRRNAGAGPSSSLPAKCAALAAACRFPHRNHGTSVTSTEIRCAGPFPSMGAATAGRRVMRSSTSCGYRGHG